MNIRLIERISLTLILLLFFGCKTDDINDNIDENKDDDISSEFIYYPAKMAITTVGNAKIAGKTKEDYVNCTIKVESDYPDWNYEGTARIRGRGNSTWLWYPKKPYRIKLDEKSKILGLKSDKDWVLLANYRDPTHAMNSFVFNYGLSENMPFTNHVRYVEVTLNGDYIGVYMLTEQVEQGKNRVNVDDTEGLLLSLDLDDGPDLSPEADDNFWSDVYYLPVCVKYPDDLTTAKLNSIRKEFATLENAIKNLSYEKIEQILDIESFIKYLIIQELVQNVEMNAPRSIFLHKDKDKKWAMGPLWDFDAGFDFDWSTMYTGHNYFTQYNELTMGNDPARTGDRGHITPFFTDLFKHKAFVKRYKEEWSIIKDKVMPVYWDETYKYLELCSEAFDRDFARWPIDKTRTREINKMRNWLMQRTLYLDSVIDGYPDGSK